MNSCHGGIPIECDSEGASLIRCWEVSTSDEKPSHPNTSKRVPELVSIANVLRMPFGTLGNTPKLAETNQMCNKNTHRKTGHGMLWHTLVAIPVFDAKSQFSGEKTS